MRDSNGIIENTMKIGNRAIEETWKWRSIGRIIGSKLWININVAEIV